MVQVANEKLKVERRIYLFGIDNSFSICIELFIFFLFQPSCLEVIPGNYMIDTCPLRKLYNLKESYP